MKKVKIEIESIKVFGTVCFILAIILSILWYSGKALIFINDAVSIYTLRTAILFFVGGIINMVYWMKVKKVKIK